QAEHEAGHHADAPGFANAPENQHQRDPLRHGRQAPGGDIGQDQRGDETEVDEPRAGGLENPVGTMRRLHGDHCAGSAAADASSPWSARPVPGRGGGTSERPTASTCTARSTRPIGSHSTSRKTPSPGPTRLTTATGRPATNSPSSPEVTSRSPACTSVPTG